MTAGPYRERLKPPSSKLERGLEAACNEFFRGWPVTVSHNPMRDETVIVAQFHPDIAPYVIRLSANKLKNLPPGVIFEGIVRELRTAQINAGEAPIYDRP